MIGLSGLKSGDFVFIEIAEVCRHRTGRAVQFPPLAAVGVFCAVGHLAGEHGLAAVLKADGDTVYLHHINDGHSGHRDRFNGWDIHGAADEGCRHFLTVHGNDGFAAKRIPIFRLQHDGIHIGLAVFKCGDGGQRAVGVVVGVPGGNGLVVFKLLPALVEDIIIVLIGCPLGGCPRGIARLIVEFHVFNGGGRDGG